MLDDKFFMNIAPNVTARFRKIIFGSESRGKDARQVNNKLYPNYTPEYSKLKKQGGGKRQDPEFRNSNAPVFTGDTQRQFGKVRPKSNGFSFGTTRGGIVEGLARKGRLISSESKPLPDKVVHYIMTEADKYVNSKLGKIKGKTIDIKLKNK